MNASRYAWSAVMLFAFVLGGCGTSTSTSTSTPVPAKSAPVTITLQTTTSPQDSGLLDFLLPKFREQTGIDVKVIAVGSGQALEHARRGDGDVVISHSPDAEVKFMNDGFGVSRRELMDNDFIVVGPPSDPAQLKGTRSAGGSFRTIRDKKAPFVSRGDDSGTHVKEKYIWARSAVEPDGDWYIKAGVGMAAALRIADEKQAYILTDKGTYLALKSKLNLVPLAAGDADFINVYSVIVVSAAKHPGLHQAEATKFAEFMRSPETQKLIGEFGKAKYGESLFRPALAEVRQPAN